MHPLESLYGTSKSKFVTCIFFKWAKTGFFLFILVLFSHCKDKYSTNLNINDKSVNGVLGSRTRDGRMERADESTELSAAPPLICDLYLVASIFYVILPLHNGRSPLVCLFWEKT